jgi:hypothetical protein
MLDELPLLSKLQTHRRPDLYNKDWNCALCNTDKETWLHLWHCPILKPLFQQLCFEVKSKMESWIIEHSNHSNVTFPSSWHNSDFWFYPTNDTSLMSFESLIRGFIPLQLTTALCTFLPKQKSLQAIGEILTDAKDSFRTQIWKLRCEKFVAFELSKGIDYSSKHSCANSSSTAQLSTSFSSLSSSISNRWKFWISRSLATGISWMDFLIHINNLIS